MKKAFILTLIALSLFSLGCSGTNAKADSLKTSFEESVNEEPIKVSVCDLQEDVVKYNHKLIEVTGFVSKGFENFTLFDPECEDNQSVWLEYGGMKKSKTIYCCNETIANTRQEPLVVENIQIPLVDDEKLKTFDNLTNRQRSALVHATVQGRFFSGKKYERPDKTYYGGYGHMGVFSLFAIQKIVEVDSQENQNLDYRLEADASELNIGDSYDFLSLYESKTEEIASQRKADSGEREWSFENPQRVATDTLSQILKKNEKSFVGIRLTRNLKTQMVYKWRQNTTGNVYVVVVSRPYWLSFYARDKNKVAWIPIGIYKITSYQK